MDAWDLDVVFTGAQKGWMSPPGLAMISVLRAPGMPRRSKDATLLLGFPQGAQVAGDGGDALDAPGEPLFALDVALRDARDEGYPRSSPATSVSPI